MIGGGVINEEMVGYARGPTVDEVRRLAEAYKASAEAKDDRRGGAADEGDRGGGVHHWDKRKNKRDEKEVEKTDLNARKVYEVSRRHAGSRSASTHEGGSGATERRSIAQAAELRRSSRPRAD